MHVLDLFNDKDRNFLNGDSAITEGGMPALNLEYEDYLKLPPMAFQSRYKISKEAWAEKYKNLLPKPAPIDPLSGIPDAPMEEGDVIQMPTYPRVARPPQSTAADVIPMIKDRSNRAYEMWKQRILRTNSDSAGKIKFYSKGNKIVAQIPSMAEPLGTFNIDTYTGTVLNEVDPNNFDSDWDYQDAVAKSGRPRSSYRSSEDDTFDADVAYSNKMYQLSQKQQRDADHDRLATGTNEGKDRVDSLVTKGLPMMRDAKWLDAVAAIKYQVGERDYRERKQFYDFFVQQLVDKKKAELAAKKESVAEGKPNLKCVCKTMGPEQCPVHAPMDEGWLKNTVAGAAIAGAALGAQARVTPDGQGGYTGGLKPTPTVTQPATNTAPSRIDSPSGPSGFSKEYLQKASDPNRTGRYLISVEKAQQLLKQTQEGVAENSGQKTFKVVYYSKKTDRNVTKTIKADNQSQVWDRLKSKGIDVVSVKEQGVAEADMNRRGFLKGMGAAAVAGVGASGQAQTDQRYDLGNSFVTASATIDGVTYRAIQDTISKSGYMLNQRSDGTPIVNRPGEFLVIRNGKIEARPSLAPNIMRALQKAGILPDDGEMQSQTAPAVTHSSRGGTNQPAVTHSSRGGTNQPAVTYSSSGRQTRNEDITSRIKMADYIKAAEDLQDRLSQAIKQGDRDLIKKLSKERDELDARVRQRGMVPESSKLNKPGKQPVGEASVQSLLASYKNLLKRVLGIAFGKKQNAGDPMAFQRMMSKIVSPVDTSKYQALWQEYKNDKHYYVPTPHPVKDINNKELMYLWSNGLVQFVTNKYPDTSTEALTQLVTALAEIGAKEALGQFHKGIDESEKQKPRVRKYTKMRPDGSKAVRYEVLDHMGRRITGQGPEGFDDLKLAKDFYYKNYDRLAALDETADGNVTDTVKMDVPLPIRIMEFAKEDAKTDMDLHDVAERLIELGKTGDTLTMQDYQDAVASMTTPKMSDTPSEPVMKEAGKRYWCSTEKRWKDR